MLKGVRGEIRANESSYSTPDLILLQRNKSALATTRVGSSDRCLPDLEVQLQVKGRLGARVALCVALGKRNIKRRNLETSIENERAEDIGLGVARMADCRISHHVPVGLYIHGYSLSFLDFENSILALYFIRVKYNRLSR